MHMTTESAACPQMPAPHGAWSRGIHLVSSRIGALRLPGTVTGAAKAPTATEGPSHAYAAQGNLYMLADTRNTGPRVPHPGDVLFWVVCLGGACLLLLIAT